MAGFHSAMCLPFLAQTAREKWGTRLVNEQRAAEMKRRERQTFAMPAAETPTL